MTSRYINSLCILLSLVVVCPGPDTSFANHGLGMNPNLGNVSCTLDGVKLDTEGVPLPQDTVCNISCANGYGLPADQPKHVKCDYDPIAGSGRWAAFDGTRGMMASCQPGIYTLKMHLAHWASPVHTFVRRCSRSIVSLYMHLATHLLPCCVVSSLIATWARRYEQKHTCTAREDVHNLYTKPLANARTMRHKIEFLSRSV